MRLLDELGNHGVLATRLLTWLVVGVFQFWPWGA